MQSLNDKVANITSEHSSENNNNIPELKKVSPFSMSSSLKQKPKQPLGLQQNFIENVNGISDLISQNGELILKS